MGEPEPVDLIHLKDADGNRCVVRVTARDLPGILTGHDNLLAEILVSTAVLDAHLETCLLQADLSSWEQGLRTLAPGGNAGIGGDRALELDLRLDEGQSLSVTLHDPDQLSTSFLIRPPHGWIRDHQDRLERLRQVWPSEVAQTSPGVYEWKRKRES